MVNLHKLAYYILLHFNPWTSKTFKASFPFLKKYIFTSSFRIGRKKLTHQIIQKSYRVFFFTYSIFSHWGKDAQSTSTELPLQRNTATNLTNEWQIPGTMRRVQVLYPRQVFIWGRGIVPATPKRLTKFERTKGPC